jgi:hypothetical protein
MPEGRPWVSMGINRSAKDKTGRPQVTLTFSESFVVHLKMLSSRIGVEIGTHEHDGWIRLRQNPEGLKPILRQRSCSLRFSCGHLGVEESHETRKLAEFSVIAKCDEEGPHIDIELPLWAGGLTEEERDERERKRIREQFPDLND